MNPQTAYLLMDRQLTLAARCALGDGLLKEEVARALRDLANAIENPGSVAEGMSALSVPME